MSPKAAEMLTREIAPRIRSSMHSFVPVGSDDREEQCQDAVWDFFQECSQLLPPEPRCVYTTPPRRTGNSAR